MDGKKVFLNRNEFQSRHHFWTISVHIGDPQSILENSSSKDILKSDFSSYFWKIWTILNIVFFLRKRKVRHDYCKRDLHSSPFFLNFFFHYDLSQRVPSMSISSRAVHGAVGDDTDDLKNDERDEGIVDRIEVNDGNKTDIIFYVTKSSVNESIPQKETGDRKRETTQGTESTDSKKRKRKRIKWKTET